MSRIMKINEKPPRLYNGEWINIIKLCTLRCQMVKSRFSLLREVAHQIFG